MIMKPNFRSTRRFRADFGARALFWIAGVMVALGIMASPGLASAAAWLDAGLTDVKPEDKVVVAHPQPVQLLFQFQTKGAPNARATKFLKAQIVDTVKASGLFSEVSDAATANGALLSVVVNNVVDPDEMHAAEGKAFVTGATFFVAGTSVRDGYICTVDYLAGPNAPKITKIAHHSIITQLGMVNSPPPGAVKIGSTNDAVMTMTRQIVSNPLNALASDPGFQAPPAAPATAADQTVAAQAQPASDAVATAPVVSPSPTAASPTAGAAPTGASSPPISAAPAAQPAPVQP
jgi:hypothetical protein